MSGSRRVVRVSVASVLVAFAGAVGAGCETGSRAGATAGAGAVVARAGEDVSALELLGQTLAAHGGLARYRRFGSMRYEMVGFPLTPHVAKPSVSTVDLVSRSNRIEGQGYTVGFDGKTAWSDPGRSAVGLPARFYTLGSFYFVGMPFVFADTGVVLKDKGTQLYRGKPYRVVNASYTGGTGFSHNDDYDLYIDPQTKRLALISHSVTEIDVARVTWEFPEWQQVSGLLVPAKMVYYAGFNPNPTEPGPVTNIVAVRFDVARPPASTYAAPTTASIESK